MTSMNEWEEARACTHVQKYVHVHTVCTSLESRILTKWTWINVNKQDTKKNWSWLKRKWGKGWVERKFIKKKKATHLIQLRQRLSKRRRTDQLKRFYSSKKRSHTQHFHPMKLCAFAELKLNPEHFEPFTREKNRIQHIFLKARNTVGR